MKKMMLLVLMLLLAPTSVLAAPPDGPKVVCRAPGQSGDYLSSKVQPFIENGRMMVPLRTVSETLGFKVQWDAQNKKVTVSNQGKTVILAINSCVAMVNGISCKMDAPARIISSHTFVPIRFMSDNLGYNVYYHQNSQTAFITYDKLVSNQEIKEILDNSNNYNSFPESAVMELKADKVLPSDIGLGDTWAMVKDVYGRPLNLVVNGNISNSLDDNAINQAENIVITYSSAFTPYSGDVCTLRFYFGKGILIKVELSFPW